MNIYLKICRIIISIIFFSFLFCVSEPLSNYKENKTYQIQKIESSINNLLIDGYLNDAVVTDKTLDTALAVVIPDDAVRGVRLLGLKMTFQ